MPSKRSPEAPQPKVRHASELDKALADIDWQQVVLNGGPPCFFVEKGKFCLRAQRWDGHDCDYHYYVSLEDLVRACSTRGPR